MRLKIKDDDLEYYANRSLNEKNEREEQKEYEQQRDYDEREKQREYEQQRNYFNNLSHISTNLNFIIYISLGSIIVSITTVLFDLIHH